MKYATKSNLAAGGLDRLDESSSTSCDPPTQTRSGHPFITVHHSMANSEWSYGTRQLCLESPLQSSSRVLGAQQLQDPPAARWLAPLGITELALSLRRHLIAERLLGDA